MNDDPLAKARDALARAAAEAAARQALDQAGAAVARVADGFADALEVALLGKKGAAEALRDAPEVDAFDRLRAAYADPAPKPTPPAPEDKLAKARAELEAMKKARR